VLGVVAGVLREGLEVAASAATLHPLQLALAGPPVAHEVLCMPLHLAEAAGRLHADSCLATGAAAVSCLVAHGCAAAEHSLPAPQNSACAQMRARDPGQLRWRWRLLPAEAPAVWLQRTCGLWGAVAHPQLTSSQGVQGMRKGARVGGQPLHQR
jgi:hypothetical protein